MVLPSDCAGAGSSYPESLLAFQNAGAQLMVAFADGTLSGCTVSGKALTSVWNVPLGAHCRTKTWSVICHRCSTHLTACMCYRLTTAWGMCPATVEQDPLEGSKPAGISRAFVRADPHPLVKGACLILIGTNTGYVTAWELTDTRSACALALMQDFCRGRSCICATSRMLAVGGSTG